MVYKRWLLAVFLLSLVLLCGVAVFNYGIDNADIFHAEHIASAANALAQGSYLEVDGNTDERIFQKFFIQASSTLPDAIALGSSRIMQMQGKDVGEGVFVNNGVSGSSLEDYFALLGIYYQKWSNFPRRVIIGVDPWIFNKNNGQTRWESIANGYDCMQGLVAHDKPAGDRRDVFFSLLRKLPQLINYEYTIANYESVVYGNKFNFKVMASENQERGGRRPDGSFFYQPYYRCPSAAKRDKAALLYAKPPVYSLEGFFEIENRLEFERLLLYLQAHGCQVTLVLFPYHPITYTILSKTKPYDVIVAVEKYILEFARQHHIQVEGSYDPNVVGVDADYFIDGMHMTDAGIEKTLACRR